MTRPTATQPELVGGLIAFAPTVRGLAAQNPELLDLALKSVSALEYASLASAVAPAWADDPTRYSTYLVIALGALLLAYIARHVIRLRRARARTAV